MKRRVMYIENKSNGVCGGEAHIGWVSFSKTGRSLYYEGHTFQSLRGRGFKANFIDTETGEEFWISGPRRDGVDRLYGERVPVPVDADAREHYWVEIRGMPERKDDPFV